VPPETPALGPATRVRSCLQVLYVCALRVLLVHAGVDHVINKECLSAWA